MACFQKVLTTFLGDFGPYWQDSIMQLLQIWQLHIYDANLLLTGEALYVGFCCCSPSSSRFDVLYLQQWYSTILCLSIMLKTSAHPSLTCQRSVIHTNAAHWIFFPFLMYFFPILGWVVLTTSTYLNVLSWLAFCFKKTISKQINRGI